jgi:hypothetical protein
LLLPARSTRSRQHKGQTLVHEGSVSSSDLGGGDDDVDWHVMAEHLRGTDCVNLRQYLKGRGGSAEFRET